MMKELKKRIVQTNTFQKVTARIYQYRKRKQMKKEYAGIIEKHNKSAQTSHSIEQKSDYVWLFWWQGETEMTPIVRECCSRIRRFNPDKNVVLITQDNLDQYVSFPEYIMDKFCKGIITKTHFSDLLRAELLSSYGGVWMDATIYTFGPIPSYVFERPLYTGRCKQNKKDYNVSRNRWTSYFWVSPWPGNTLFCFLKDFWKEYWKRNDVLTDYFLIDYVIDLGYHTISEIKRDLDEVDIDGVGNDFWQLLSLLREDYTEELLEGIKEKNWMQKLSYKGEQVIQKKALHPEISVYRTLFLDGDKAEC